MDTEIRMSARDKANWQHIQECPGCNQPCTCKMWRRLIGRFCEGCERRMAHKAWENTMRAFQSVLGGRDA